MKISQAIIPAAGLGTRFLPFTKSTPKELLPLLGTPAIEYILREGLSSGITDYTIITNTRKSAIQKHLSKDEELMAHLAVNNKHTQLNNLNALLDACNFSYIMQENPRGLGHAISLTEKQIDQDYFSIFLPDDIIISNKPCLAQLMDVAKTFSSSVIAVQEVSEKDTNKYGIVGIEKELAPGVYEVSHLVEKPLPNQAPSNLGIIGRYVLSRNIFSSLHEITPGSGNELQITDAIAHMGRKNERIIAYKIEGSRFDTGTPQGWLEAIVNIAAQEPAYASIIENSIVKTSQSSKEKAL